MKSTRLIVATLFLCSLSACQYVAPILKLPGQAIKAGGRAVGMGLTDEAPQPYDDEPCLEEPTTQETSKAVQE